VCTKEEEEMLTIVLILIGTVVAISTAISILSLILIYGEIK